MDVLPGAYALSHAADTVDLLVVVVLIISLIVALVVVCPRLPPPSPPAPPLSSDVTLAIYSDITYSYPRLMLNGQT